MQIDIADAQFNGTNCGIDVTTKVKGMCHNKDRCQLYASSATMGNSGCNPGTATLVIGYSCKGKCQSSYRTWSCEILSKYLSNYLI